MLLKETKNMNSVDVNVGISSLLKKRYETDVGVEPNRTLESLTPEEKLMAWVSKLAYKKIQNRREMILSRPEYFIDETLSGDNSVVVVPTEEDHAIIGFRGTNPTRLDDIIAGIHVLADTLDKSVRFKDALATYRQVSQKYGLVKVTGHSLGGTQAIYIARKFPVDCWAWNPGQGISKRYLDDKTTYPNIRTYHIIGDPLSRFAGLENPDALYRFPTISQDKILGNHSLDIFLK